jgi:hypothetical protein
MNTAAQETIMKSYESATLVELGNASQLVLGIDGDPPDAPNQNPLHQWVPTVADIDE